METVLSADGTAIAYERCGAGPPLVLVHGTGRDRSHWTPSLPGFARDARVYALDRRGRGGSGDVDRYALAREVEDILAVIDAIGEPVHLLGHSYGAIVALTRSGLDAGETRASSAAWISGCVMRTYPPLPEAQMPLLATTPIVRLNRRNLHADAS